MNQFENIKKKLHQFTRKYYTNELIKGSILFLSLGFLYLFCTLFLEYFFWLQPTARALLFWFFIFFELFLLIRLIVIPITKLVGFRKGISLQEFSKIIGNHFPEVQDKLLNILQLKENDYQSDLILASINQKSAELQPIPFLKAIDFTQNKKYIKYALVPLLIYFVSLFTGTDSALTQSLVRVVNYKTAYIPPAPFAFSLNTNDLTVIQGESKKIAIDIVGKVIPDEAKIFLNNQEYFLEKSRRGVFYYTFSDVQNTINFYFESNGIQSNNYRLNVIATPTISNVFLEVNYPKYLKKQEEIIQNSANLLIPEGTTLTWKVKTAQTDSLSFIDQKRHFFNKIGINEFRFTKQIFKPINYQITSSNRNLKDYENLEYFIDVIRDQYPQITVNSNIDSLSSGPAQFAGQISDDYGLQKLQLIYYDEETPNIKQSIDIQINRVNIQTFFYDFPKDVNLKKGINYELYFQVYDNDGVNGNKSAKSTVFKYRQKTNDEIEEEFLQDQKNTMNSLENSITNQKQQQEKLNEIQQDLQKKKNLNWNDQQKVENFIKRQELYNKMMQRQTDELEQSIDEKKEEKQSLQEKKEDLKERIHELKKLEKQQKLLDEIQKMADKLNKDDLVKKAKELAQQNKQQQRSLEKTLELVKRFYVEQKTMQIANKLDKLSKKQNDLEKKEISNIEDQQQIKKEFDEIKEELEALTKDNDRLKKPMELPDVDNEKEKVEEALEKVEDHIKKNNQSKAKQNQKNSSKKMKEMSNKMQQSMLEMQGETLEENMDDLRKILENLVIFSVQQEQLMNKFQEISTSHPDFGKVLKKQNQIKTYFEHIDDSLYVLSMRVPKISNKIQNDLSSAHYNLDQSLNNFSENRFPNGISNQRYVMTASNNLADYLSDILNNMQNNMSIGKGKKGKSKGFSLPDLIKKQQGVSEQMKKGMQKGKKQGEGKESQGSKGEAKDGDKKNNKPSNSGTQNNDDMDGELYEIYKQQSQLRQELQNAIQQSEQGNKGVNAKARKALKSMEELENEILEKGFNQTTLQKMQNLNYELLKLDTASLQQGKDKNRKSETNKNINQRNRVKALEFKKQFYNQVEILNRQSLPLQHNFKQKVRIYFSNNKND